MVPPTVNDRVFHNLLLPQPFRKRKQKLTVLLQTIKRAKSQLPATGGAAVSLVDSRAAFCGPRSDPTHLAPFCPPLPLLACPFCQLGHELPTDKDVTSLSERPGPVLTQPGSCCGTVRFASGGAWAACLGRRQSADNCVHLLCGQHL